jgi:UDP:flavonoid glycosyltransferase YjiC (YdhE family)
VQPYCALGMGLKRAGHEVTVVANENFESFVRQFGLEFAAITPSDARVSAIQKRNAIDHRGKAQARG